LPPHAQRPCRWRPRKLTPEDIVAARKHMIDGKLKAKDIAKMYGVSERSLWRNLRWAAELEAQRQINARLDALTEVLVEAATRGEIEDVPDVGIQ
jgi:uncharacterized protein YjcR